jgi:hypothetical protein
VFAGVFQLNTLIAATLEATQPSKLTSTLNTSLLPSKEFCLKVHLYQFNGRSSQIFPPA